jgi:hypothetical protein
MTINYAEQDILIMESEIFSFMANNVDYYRTFNVLNTFEVRHSSDIIAIVDYLADFLGKNACRNRYSFRILLPITKESPSLPRKWGASLRSQLVLALKRRHIKVRLREVRYIHDDVHYGWLLMGQDLLENSEN